MNSAQKRVFRLLREMPVVILTALVMLNASYGVYNAREVINEFTGTDEHTPPQENRIAVSVSKVWKPAANHPNSVTVQLYRNGNPNGNPVTLSDSNGWKHTWTGLDTSSVWTVNETDVPSGYVHTITGSVRDGFVVTNTRPNRPDKPDKPEEPKPPPDPIVPVDPDVPTGPGFPTEPGGPTEPNDPTEPNKPGAPGNPNVPVIPDKPRDPGKPPKTGDDADARPWLIILAVSAYILRYVLFIKKN